MQDPNSLEIKARRPSMASSASHTANAGKNSVMVGCDSCGVTLFVIRRGIGNQALSCHGRLMTPRGAQPCAEVFVPPARDGVVVGRLYTDQATGLLARCTRSGQGVVSCGGRPLAPAEAQQMTLPHRDRPAPAPQRVGLLVEARRMRWNAVDWACASARRSDQVRLPILLDCGLWWCRAGLDVPVMDENIAAWSEVREYLQDAVMERVLGWGVEPVIRPLAGHAPWQAFADGEERPEFLVVSTPGRWSWLSRRLIRQLNHNGWPVTLIG
jgi:hypothetical protein